MGEAFQDSHLAILGAGGFSLGRAGEIIPGCVSLLFITKLTANKTVEFRHISEGPRADLEMPPPLHHFAENAMATKRNRVAIAVVAGAAILTAAAGVASSLGEIDRHHAKEHEIEDLLQTAQALASSLDQAEGSQRDFVLTGEARYLSFYNRAILAINSKLAALDRAASEGAISRTEVSRLDVKLRSGLAELSKGMETPGKQRLAPKSEGAVTLPENAALSESRLILQTWSEEKLAELANERSLGQQDSRRIPIVTTAGAGILLCLLLLATIGNEQVIARLGNLGRAAANQDLASRSLIDAMPDIVLQFSAGGRAEYFNHKWFEYTGFHFEETYGFQWTRALHAQDRERAAAAWREAILEKKPYEIQYRLRRGVDGTYRWHLNRCVPQKDGEGRLLRWIATCTDIDDLLHARTAMAQCHEDTPCD